MRSASPAALAWLRAITSSERAAPRLRPATGAASRSFPVRASRQRAAFYASSASPRAGDSSPASPTHYALFRHTFPGGGQPFVVDASALKREFLRLQAQTHPDMHAGADKAKAEALSARLNDAYKTLADPLLRAQYLLSLHGMDVHTDESAKVDDPDLLMEVLQARETIEEATAEEHLQELAEINDRRMEGSIRGLEQSFGHGHLDEAAREAVRLRYWVNIKEALQGWEKGKPVVLGH